MIAGSSVPPAPLRVLGRYALHGQLAVGGMAVVHLGRLLGPVGFARTVAIKQLLPQFASDPDFVTMFLDEARVASRVRHPNVVATFDVVVEGDEIFLVMDYVQGETLSRLLRASASRRQLVPPAIAVNVVLAALAGLHAAHEATTEQGAPLHLVHRDMSPQNVMVGVDGSARVLDFGVAKAVGRAQHTREGEIKGKIAYMAPEQIRGRGIDRRADIYATSVMLWEALTLRRLIRGETDAERMYQVLQSTPEPPSVYAPGVSPALDAVVLRGLSARPEDRFATAAEMALALEKTAPILSTREIGAWVVDLAGDSLAKRAIRVEEIERSGASITIPIPIPIPIAPAPLADPETATRLMERANDPSARGPAARSARVTRAIGAVGLLGIGALFAWHFGARRADPPGDAVMTSASATPSASAAAPSLDDASTPAIPASAPASSVTAARAEPSDRAAIAPPAGRSAAPAAPARKPPLEHLPLYKRE
ncbi:MAG: serine/threonine-protein kinase [Byssovorax sp.]